MADEAGRGPSRWFAALLAVAGMAGGAATGAEASPAPEAAEEAGAGEESTDSRRARRELLRARVLTSVTLEERNPWTAFEFSALARAGR